MARGVFGREAELRAVDALLASARQGLAALVLEGDPGIGKTTVWRKGIARAVAEGYRVLSCRAAPAEVQLPFDRVAHPCGSSPGKKTFRSLRWRTPMKRARASLTVDVLEGGVMLRGIRALRYVGFLLMAVIMHGSAATGQTTTFTYQGRLTDAGVPANGSYDLRFALFDSAAEGAQIGSDQSVPAVPVSAGVFTVQLDFGVSAFPGANRFLEIAVRPAAGGSFTTLAPRQQLTSTPYAIQTLNAEQLGGVPASQYVKADSNGNVGVGTTAPNHRLRISGGPPWTTAAWSGALELDNASAVGWHANSDAIRFGIGQTNGGLYFFRTQSDPGTTGSDANYDLLIDDSGNVGIGTTTPQSKLSVQADGFGWTHTDGTVTVGSYVDGIGGYLGTRSNHPLHFFTNNSAVPQMTVATSGNVGIGTQSPGAKLDVRVATGPGVYAESTLGTGVEGHGFHYGVFGSSDMGTGVYGRSPEGFAGKFDGQVLVGGPLVVDSPTGNGQLVVFGGGVVHGFLEVQYAQDGTETVCRNGAKLANCSSSLRYKTAIRPFRGGLELIDRLRPISFTWKSNGAPDLGLGAEDVAAVEPLLVTHNDKGEIEGVKYDRLSGVFINAFKEQQAQITQQQAQVAQQQREIDELKRTCLAGSPRQPVKVEFRRNTAILHEGTAFNLGEDDKHIAPVDADGVALAAIQGLYQIVQEKDRQLQELQVRVRQLERQVQHKRDGRGS